MFLIFSLPGGGSCLLQECLRLVLCSLINKMSYSSGLGAFKKWGSYLREGGSQFNRGGLMENSTYNKIIVRIKTTVGNTLTR